METPRRAGSSVGGAGDNQVDVAEPREDLGRRGRRRVRLPLVDDVGEPGLARRRASMRRSRSSKFAFVLSRNPSRLPARVPGKGRDAVWLTFDSTTGDSTRIVLMWPSGQGDHRTPPASSARAPDQASRLSGSRRLPAGHQRRITPPDRLAMRKNAGWGQRSCLGAPTRRMGAVHHAGARDVEPALVGAPGVDRIQLVGGRLGQ